MDETTIELGLRQGRPSEPAYRYRLDPMAVGHLLDRAGLPPTPEEGPTQMGRLLTIGSVFKVGAVALLAVAVGVTLLPRGPQIGAAPAAPAPSASDPIDLAKPPIASPSPAEASAMVRGWPEGRAERNTPGLYSWTPMDLGRMSSGLAKIRMDKLDDPDSNICARYGYCQFTDYVRSKVGFDGPRSDVPTSISDELDPPLREQLWYVDGDEMRVFVLLQSYPEIEPAALAAAEMIVRSVHWEPSGTGDGGRFVFELPAGWGSG